MGFASEARTISGWKRPPNRKPLSSGSRLDFGLALATLSGKPPRKGCRFELGDLEITGVRVAFLRCTLGSWLEVCGEPESIYEHSISTPRFPVHVWKYQCSDGPIACVGFRSDSLDGDRWVTFVRLCYF